MRVTVVGSGFVGQTTAMRVVGSSQASTRSGGTITGDRSWIWPRASCVVQVRIV